MDHYSRHPTATNHLFHLFHYYYWKEPKSGDLRMLFPAKSILASLHPQTNALSRSNTIFITTNLCDRLEYLASKTHWSPSSTLANCSMRRCVMILSLFGKLWLELLIFFAGKKAPLTMPWDLNLKIDYNNWHAWSPKNIPINHKWHKNAMGLQLTL